MTVVTGIKFWYCPSLNEIEVLLLKKERLNFIEGWAIPEVAMSIEQARPRILMMHELPGNTSYAPRTLNNTAATGCKERASKT